MKIEASIAAERLALQANEFEIECVVAARAINNFEASCPGANRNPAHGRFMEAFVSLAADVSRPGKSQRRRREETLARRSTRHRPCRRPTRLCDGARAPNILPRWPRHARYHPMRPLSRTTGTHRIGTRVATSRTRYPRRDCRQRCQGRKNGHEVCRRGLCCPAGRTGLRPSVGGPQPCPGLLPSKVLNLRRPCRSEMRSAYALVVCVLRQPTHTSHDMT